MDIMKKRIPVSFTDPSNPSLAKLCWFTDDEALRLGRDLLRAASKGKAVRISFKGERFKVSAVAAVPKGGVRGQ
jgi:hypothetical protein